MPSNACGLVLDFGLLSVAVPDSFVQGERSTANTAAATCSLAVVEGLGRHAGQYLYSPAPEFMSSRYSVTEETARGIY
jgi:hypothetical protein